MTRLAAAAIGLAVGGAVLGVLLSQNRLEDEVNQQKEWREPASPPDLNEKTGAFRATIARSGILGEDAAAAAGDAEGPEGSVDGTGEPAVTPFPEIVAVGILDGREIVSLRDDDGAISRHGIADQLPGDWVITGISLDAVIARRNGVELTFAVFNFEPATVAGEN